MKKSLLFIPLVLALSACQKNSAPVSETDIPNAAPINLGTDVQPVAMPTSMGQQGAVRPSVPSTPTLPSYNPPAYSTPNYSGSGYSGASQPSYSQPAYSASAVTSQVGGCQVSRDANNAPIYAQIQKGCYSDSQYTVAKGDTIFLIAYLTGKPVDEIARLNQLSQPYQLKVGQTLRVR